MTIVYGAKIATMSTSVEVLYTPTRFLVITISIEKSIESDFTQRINQSLLDLSNRDSFIEITSNWFMMQVTKIKYRSLASEPDFLITFLSD